MYGRATPDKGRELLLAPAIVPARGIYGRDGRSSCFLSAARPTVFAGGRETSTRGMAPAARRAFLAIFVVGRGGGRMNSLFVIETCDGKRACTRFVFVSAFEYIYRYLGCALRVDD